MESDDKSTSFITNNIHDYHERRNLGEEKQQELEKENCSLTKGSKNGTSIKLGNESEFNAYGFTLLFSSFCLRFVIMGISSSSGILTRVLLDSVEAGQGELNWIGSISTGCMMLFGPLAGSIETRFDARVLSSVGAILSTVGVACSFLVDKYYFLYITYGAFGGCGLAFFLMTALVPLTVHFKTKRTFANGIANMGGGLGTTLLPMVITFLDEVYGWRGMFLIMAGLYFQVLVFAVLIRPDYKQKIKTPNLNRRRSSVADDSKEIFANRFFWLYCGAGLLANTVISIPFYLLPVKSASAGLSPTEQAFIFTAIGIVNIINRPIFGVIMDKIQRYTILMQGVMVIVLMLVTLWLPFLQSKASFYIYGVIIGITHGCYLVLQPLSVLDIVSKRLYSLGLGHFRLMIFVGVVTGAPAAGWLVDLRGGYDWACYFCSSLGIMGGVLMCFINILFLRQQKSEHKVKDQINTSINS